MSGLIISAYNISIVHTSYVPPDSQVSNLEYVDTSNILLIEGGFLKLVNE